MILEVYPEPFFASEVMSELVRESTEDLNDFWRRFISEESVKVPLGCEFVPLSAAASSLVFCPFGNAIICVDSCQND